MKKIPLEIVALSHSVTQTHSFAVILGELGGTRRLPIVIGGYEAQAIAVALDNMKPSRPLTHDLMKNVCDAFHLELDHIFISRLSEGIFYSTLVFTDTDDTIEIDSRTSDAIAMAVRFECPIFVAETILNEAGVETNKDDLDLPIEQDEESLIEKTIEELTGGGRPSSPSAGSNFSNLSDADLETEMQIALQNEDYERAARLRDELNKRK